MRTFQTLDAPSLGTAGAFSAFAYGECLAHKPRL